MRGISNVPVSMVLRSAEGAQHHLEETQVQVVCPVSHSHMVQVPSVLLTKATSAVEVIDTH